MKHCPFCASPLRHYWPPTSWFDCGTKVGTRVSPKALNRDHQAIGCLKLERDRLEDELEKAREKISRLKEQAKQ